MKGFKKLGVALLSATLLLSPCISTVKASLKDIGRTHIEKIYQLANSPGNRQISLPYGIIVKKEYDNIIFKVTDNEKCLKQAVPFVKIPYPDFLPELT